MRVCHLALTSLTDWACAYADRGWFVVPLWPNQKEPYGPLVPNGYIGATDDLSTVFAWWSQNPNLNIGLACHQSGIVVLDMDPRNGGEEGWNKLEDELGFLPKTLTAVTGRGDGGHHYLFQHPGGNLRGKAGTGVDVKDYGYIVLAPSIHPDSGKPYEWLNWGTPIEALTPPWRMRLQAPSRDDAPTTVNSETDDPLRHIPAAEYIFRLTGRSTNRDGFIRCPLHSGGNETDASLRVNGVVWSCFGCEPFAGKRVAGGNIYDFAACLWGFPLPLRGIDFADVQGRLTKELL